MADGKKTGEKNAAAAKEAAGPQDAHFGDGIMDIIREWADALVIAFVLAMFVRVFVVELFKIPTGSMTPTLLGDYVADYDWDEDGLKDLVVKGQSTLVFINKGDRYEIDEQASSHASQVKLGEIQRQGLFHAEYDRILVNKFAYWRRPPERGDVVVFKVPDVIWDPAKPIYIKRAVGLPGETLSFAKPAQGSNSLKAQLVINGEPVTEPEFFQRHRYTPYVRGPQNGQHPWMKTRRVPNVGLLIEEARIPDDGLFVMGDNTDHSADSRYWGEVPLNHLKGKAFVRYWPLKKLKFIK